MVIVRLPTSFNSQYNRDLARPRAIEATYAMDRWVQSNLGIAHPHSELGTYVCTHMYVVV